MKPPSAKKIVYQAHYHGDTLTDPYHWLRDPQWPHVEGPDILAYLEAENAYYKSVMQPLAQQEEAIYQELLGKIKLADSSVPVKKNNYYYYTRTNEESNYPMYCRKHQSLASDEHIILDMNSLAAGKEFFSYNSVSVSPDQQKIAYTTDVTGAERFVVHVKDLTNGSMADDTITDVIHSVVWHENKAGFFYCKLNQHWRPDQVFYHALHTSSADDVLIYKEDNPLCRLHIDKSASKRFIFIGSYTKESAEVFFIDCASDTIVPTLFLKRSEKHVYFPDHRGEEFFILTNDKGKNFRLVKTPIDKIAPDHWQEVIAHSSTCYLQSVVLYQDYFAVQSREEGLEKIKIYAYNAVAHPEIIQFPDPTYSASVVPTTIDAEGVRIVYSSLNVPDTTLEYGFASKKLITLKVQEIPAGFDSALYQSERIFATSQDGTAVPVSLVYKKSLFKKNGTNPLYLYGYGSYGHGISASFRSDTLPLLDRGFVYAIAHVRGGDEMGYEWYESAKFLTKKLTFADFIAAAEYLIKEKYTAKMVIAGASAGGLLIGACMNERPELFHAAIAHVPFVDVLNTMLDEKLPLTPAEFKEWGDPSDERYYHYIKSYSPYENVKPQNYPALYVTAGISDPRVTYWEPAKWVAKLREMKTDDNLLLLETNMHAGHAGASGRFGCLRDVAKEYNFIFKVFSISFD